MVMAPGSHMSMPGIESHAGDAGRREQHDRRCRRLVFRDPDRRRCRWPVALVTERWSGRRRSLAGEERGEREV